MTKWEYRTVSVYYTTSYPVMQNNVVTDSAGRTVTTHSKNTMILGEGWYDRKDRDYTQPVELEQLLMYFGQEGWELVNALQFNNNTVARLIFKRPATSDQSPTNWPGYEDSPASRESRPPQ